MGLSSLLKIIITPECFALQAFQFSPSSLFFPKKCSFLPKIGGIPKAFEPNGFEAFKDFLIGVTPDMPTFYVPPSSFKIR